VVEIGDKRMARCKVAGKKDVRKGFDDRQQAIAHLEKMRVLKRSRRADSSIRQAAYAVTSRENRADFRCAARRSLRPVPFPHSESEKPGTPKGPGQSASENRCHQEDFADRRAASIKPHEIKDWLISLGLAAGTLNRYKSTLSAIYTYAKERELVESNPCEDVPHFTVVLGNSRWMNESEEDKLRTVIQKWIYKTSADHKITRLLLREHLNEITVGWETYSPVALKNKHIEVAKGAFQ
jgi:hypothetical protein